MEYSKPQDIIFDKDIIAKLNEISSQPCVLKGFFSKDEIAYINQQKDSGVPVDKLGKVSNWKYDKNIEFKDWLEKKLQSALTRSFTMHGGNYFQTKEH